MIAVLRGWFCIGEVYLFLLLRCVGGVRVWKTEIGACDLIDCESVQVCSNFMMDSDNDGYPKVIDKCRNQIEKCSKKRNGKGHISNDNVIHHPCHLQHINFLTILTNTINRGQ